MRGRQEEIAQIETHTDLAKFIQQLREELNDRSEQWENSTLERYLEAMAGVVSDIDGYFNNSDKPLPAAETYRTMATILTASTMYE